MAEGQSMTVADVVARAMDGRLEDFVKEAVALVARELMEGEVSAEIAAALGEVAPGSRLTDRMGIARGGGNAGWGDRAVDPEEAIGPVVLSVFLGAEAAL